MKYSLITLKVSFVLKLLFILLLNPTLWNDEMVIFSISKLPANILLDTIAAERHPPLYYFIAKLLSDTNINLSRIVITIISYGSLLLILRLTNRIKQSTLCQFDLGFAFFLTSYTFLTISSDLKRQAISFPIFISCIIVSYILTIRKRPPTIRPALFLNTLLVFLFLSDYIEYFWAIASLSVLCFYFKRKFLFKLTAASQLTMFTVYLFLFGGRQIQYIVQGQKWISEFANSWPNNPLSAFLQHIAGTYPAFAIPVVLVLSLFCFSWFAKLIRKNSRVGITLLILFLTAVSVPYFAHLYVRSRYSYFPFLLLGIGASQEIIKMKLSNTKVLIILAAMFVLGATGYIDHKTWLNKFNTNLQSMLNSIQTTNNVGFLTNGQNIFPKVFNSYYLENKHMIPLNAATMAVFESDILSSEEIIAHREVELEDKLKKSIVDNNIDKIAYLYINYPIQREDTVGHAISIVCAFDKTIKIVPGRELRKYNCEPLQ